METETRAALGARLGLHGACSDLRHTHQPHRPPSRANPPGNPPLCSRGQPAVNDKNPGTGAPGLERTHPEQRAFHLFYSGHPGPAAGWGKGLARVTPLPRGNAQGLVAPFSQGQPELMTKTFHSRGTLSPKGREQLDLEAESARRRRLRQGHSDLPGPLQGDSQCLPLFREPTFVN